MRIFRFRAPHRIKNASSAHACNTFQRAKSRRLSSIALNKVEICGVNTSRLPVLTNEEKDELFAKIRQGDIRARELFINGNLRLVLSVIKRFSSSNENVDDLFQIGCIGLIKAIDNFNTEPMSMLSTQPMPPKGKS